MNELLSEYWLCHWQKLVVVLHERQLLTITCNAVVAWFALKNNMIWITSMQVSNQRFALLHGWTQWLWIIGELIDLHIIAIFHIIV